MRTKQRHRPTPGKKNGMKITGKWLRAAFQEELTETECRLYALEIRWVMHGFRHYLGQLPTPPALTGDETEVLLTIQEYLQFAIREVLDHIYELNRLRGDFSAKAARSGSPAERNEYILQAAAQLGATARELDKDRLALARWLGVDTILQRFQVQIASLEYRLTFLLLLVSQFIPRIMARKSAIELEQFWLRFDLNPLLEETITYRGDKRVAIMSFRCFARFFSILSAQSLEKVGKDTLINFTYRAAQDRSQDIWIQYEAMILLLITAPAAFVEVAGNRLRNPAGGDDFFVRRKIVALAENQMVELPGLCELLLELIHDPSPFVRKGLAEALMTGMLTCPDRQLQFQAAFLHLLHDDPAHQVRAAAVLTLEHLAGKLDGLKVLISTIAGIAAREHHSFVLRVLCTVLPKCLLVLVKGNRQDNQRRFLEEAAVLLANLHSQAGDLSVRRRAAQCQTTLEVLASPEGRQLLDELTAFVVQIRPGRGKRLPGRLASQAHDPLFRQALVCLAQNDFGFSLERSWFGTRLVRGEVFGFRSWRLFHELCHPSPDKRQAFNHTVGRINRGTMKIPSAIMSELTKTKVPGEPLYQAEEDGWRPYLPMVDDVLASVQDVVFCPPRSLFTAEGRTRIIPPDSIFRRALAAIILTLRFAKFAELRNWQEGCAETPSRYAEALGRLGINLRFDRPKTAAVRTSEDPAVRRFFPPAMALLDPAMLERLREYTFSVYENSFFDLALFTTALLLLFFGRRLQMGYQVRRARRALPLVIGGWGTRGKSGVERLKAGLMEALGHSMLSKSTGCEAMFLVSHPFGRTREMFLFRSYDKATIWEHHFLLRFARKMGSRVFLWECMGLTPAYVEILQRSWSRDDIATITNTYPDHEDIQGPAGYNIPEVMTCFIPKRASLITAEEHMHPVLAHAARRKGTSMLRTDFLDTGLLTPDVLARFPYAEHPANIALVLGVAKQMGLDRDFALREMADRVVPDIGVLKAFPVASVMGHRLEFVNGMSANERFATLSNWQRMGFADTPLDRAAGVYLCTVVNNRADRVSRSQMFARLLAEELSADRHFLIGSNLSGLLGYIERSWAEHLQSVNFFAQGPDRARELFIALAARLRIPANPDFIEERMRALLPSSFPEKELRELQNAWLVPDLLRTRLVRLETPHVESILRHQEELLARHQEYQAFLARLAAGNISEAGLREEMNNLVTKWFMAKFVVVEDYHASGNQIIATICRETPPSLLVRVMGIQNIKGTGLDFVYRWQGWLKCFQACTRLRDKNKQQADAGLRELLNFHDYSILCEEYVQESIVLARKHPFAQTEDYQAQLDIIAANMTTMLAEIKTNLFTTRKRSLLARATDAAEAVLDAGDAIKRRGVANRIYADLITQRISFERAATELALLNKRQKGGWLYARLTGKA